MVGKLVERPSIDEFLAYAKPLIHKFINEFASDNPFEIKEEIEQYAYVRLLKAYKKIDEDKGWKSFVYTHCRGAVLDYQKYGIGFEEQRHSIQKTEENGSVHISKIRERVEIGGSEDANGFDLDFTLGAYGIFSGLKNEKIDINWELLSRLSSADIGLHCFSKYLLGFEFTEISKVIGISPIMVAKNIKIFLEKFDDPHLSENNIFIQTIFALGLSKKFGLPERDLSELLGYQLGWNLPCVDLWSEDSYKLKGANYFQLSFGTFELKKKDKYKLEMNEEERKLNEIIHLEFDFQISLLFDA